MTRTSEATARPLAPCRVPAALSRVARAGRLGPVCSVPVKECAAGDYEQARAHYSQAIALSDGKVNELGHEECAVFYANRASALLMLVTPLALNPRALEPVRTRTR